MDERIGNVRRGLMAAWVLAMVLGIGAAQPPATNSRAEIIGALTAKLADTDPRARESATEALAEFGPEIIPELHVAHDAATDAEARSRLEWLVHRLTIDQAFSELLSDQSSVRNAALEKLKTYGRAVVPRMRTIMQTGFVNRVSVPRDVANAMRTWVNDTLRDGRDLWSYDNRGGGYFKRAADGTWSEFSEGRRVSRYREYDVTEERIWLEDSFRRGWHIRLYSTYCELCWDGSGAFGRLYPGGFQRRIDPRSEWHSLGCELRNEENLVWKDSRGDWTWDECDRTNDYVEICRPSVRNRRPITVFLRLYVDRAEECSDGETWGVGMEGNWSEWIAPESSSENTVGIGPPLVPGNGRWIDDRPAPGPLRAAKIWADASGIRALELVPYFRSARRFGVPPVDLQPAIIELAGGEFITGISGFAADTNGDGHTDCVTEISIATNRRAIGPFGDKREGDAEFEYVVAGGGQEVCGFYGRFSNRVHRVGIIVRDRP